MTTTTTRADDILAALDFDPSQPCTFLRTDEGPCATPATWEVVVVILDAHGTPAARVREEYCTAHKESVCAHMASCPRCGSLLHLHSAERIR